MSQTIFIISAPSDNEIANQIQRDLQAQGVAVWNAQAQVPPGSQEWQAAMQQGMAVAQTVLLCVSPAAQQSGETNQALQVALGYRKPIMLVWVGGEQWQTIAPPNLAMLPYFDVRGPNYYAGMTQVFRQLGIAGTVAPPAYQPLYSAPAPVMPTYPAPSPLEAPPMHPPQGYPTFAPPQSDGQTVLPPTGARRSRSFVNSTPCVALIALLLVALGVVLAKVVPSFGAAGSSTASHGTTQGTTTGQTPHPSATNTPKACVPPVNVADLHLVQAGKLTIATDATYPPQEFVDPTTQQITGMDVDLAREFARRLCLTANVQNIQFNTIISGITSGPPGNQYYDMSISAFNITSDRLQVVDMIPYFQASESLLVPSGNPKHITGLTSLCGLPVAVEAGTIEESEIKNVPGVSSGTPLNAPGGACVSNPVHLQSFNSEDQVIQALVNGSVDATYHDSPVSDYYASQSAGTISRGPVTMPYIPAGIVVRKDNPTFEHAITTILSAMRADGTYRAILQKWGETPGAYPPLQG